MEYVQMTLSEWLETKQKLKQELIGVKRSFVRIGYMLRKIEDQRGYEQDGYKSIAEFAQKELGLHPSTTTRFMEINREYSIDGYSERLRGEYEDLSRSQLEEMLKLPDSDRKMIRPETARDDIRELKKFNKAAPAAGEADDLKQLIILFFKEDRKALDNLYLLNEDATEAVEEMKEIINPSGNRSYRKGMYFLIFYETKICVKKFGEPPCEMSWDDFAVMVQEIYGPLEAGKRTWEAFYGEPEEENGENEETEKKKQDAEQGDDEADMGVDEERKQEEDVENGDDYKSDQRQQADEEIAPAQKSPENKKILNAEPVLGDEKPDMNQPEIIEPLITRKEYLETLTAWGMAYELEKVCKVMAEPGAEFWCAWLDEKVTKEGYEIDEEDHTRQSNGEIPAVS